MIAAPAHSSTPALDQAGLPPWPNQKIRVGGQDLFVIDHGPTQRPADARGEGRTLLLLHGAQGNWSHWRANIEALSRCHRVIVPDMPGFGWSGDLQEPGLAGLANALSAMTDALGLNQVVLVGYSFGSLVATTLAGLRPDRVQRLMLINPPGWRERSPEVVELQIQAAQLSKQAGLRAGLSFTLREIMLCHPQWIDQACLDASEFAVRKLRLVSKDISRSVDLLALLKAVTAPWCVVFSSQDPYHRDKLEQRRTRLAELRGAPCTTVVADARHWVQQDRPDAFNTLVCHWADPDQDPASMPALV